MTSIVRLPEYDRDELTSTLQRWHDSYPHMGVLALLPENENPAVPEIQALFREQGVPLLGAIFPALIEGSRFYSSGILLFCFERMPPHLLVAELNQQEEQLASKCDETAEKLSVLLESCPAETSLFMIFDAMLPHIGQILENLYMELADRVHYMGVNAGSETFEAMPCLFDSEQLIGEGMLALLLSEHPGATLEHGYQVPERLVAATSTVGNRIITIDWRPAFDVYAEVVHKQYGVEITPENFYQYAVHYPFGIIRADNEILVRIPVALMEDGSLFCVGEIPPNAVLTLLDAPTPDSSETVKRLLQRLPGDKSDNELLLFYCAGRRLHLGLEAAETELMHLQNAHHGGQLVGALSLGEIGSSLRGGYPLFHNATLVAAEIA